MNTLIGWAIYGFAQAGEWLLLPLGLAAGYGLYRLTALIARRAAARRAERIACFRALLDEARARDAAAIANQTNHIGTDTDAYAECEAIWAVTRKETQQ